MIYYFVEFAGSFANIALLVLFVDRLFQKKRFIFTMVLSLYCASNRWAMSLKSVSNLGDATNDLLSAGRLSSGHFVL